MPIHLIFANPLYVLFFRLPRRIEEQGGAFLCPHCESMQPCTGYKVMRNKNLEGEFVECLTCRGKQKGEDFKYNSTTQVFDPVMWDCPYCKALNPNNTFRCRTCYKSLV